jgi:hypothetical protein
MLRRGPRSTNEVWVDVLVASHGLEVKRVGPDGQSEQGAYLCCMVCYPHLQFRRLTKRIQGVKLRLVQFLGVLNDGVSVLF